MKKILPLVALFVAAAPAAAQVATVTTTTTPVVAARGQMIVDANGVRLGAVNRLTNGSPQIIIEGRVVTVPASTLTANGSRLQTNLTRSALLAAR